MKAKIPAVLLTVALLAACKGVPQRSGEEGTLQRYMSYAGQPLDSFSALTISGWSALGRDKLVVWTGVNDAYLLTVESSCMSLEFAETIGVTTSVGSNVQSRFDYVRFRDGFRRERCRILEIRPLDYRRMKEEQQ
jgi:hypothetical protein